MSLVNFNENAIFSALVDTDCIQVCILKVEYCVIHDSKKVACTSSFCLMNYEFNVPEPWLTLTSRPAFQLDRKISGKQGQTYLRMHFLYYGVQL